MNKIFEVIFTEMLAMIDCIVSRFPGRAGFVLRQAFYYLRIY